MEIKIPQKYIRKFASGIYLSTHKEGVLLMSYKEYQKLKDTLKRLNTSEYGHITSFIEGSIIRTSYGTNGEIYIPEVFVDRIKNKPYKLRKESLGIVVF